MRRLVTCGGALALLLTLLSTGWGLFPAGQPSNETSVLAAPPPTATYVSELAPAVMLPPRDEPAALPSSGGGQGADGPGLKLAGLGLGLLGLVLVHTARALRPKGAP